MTNHSNFNARAKNIFILNQSQIEARQKSTFQNMIDMNKHEMNFRDISQIEIVTQLHWAQNVLCYSVNFQFEFVSFAKFPSCAKTPAALL